MLPTSLLDDRHRWLLVVRFWTIAWLGNLAGAWLFGHLIAISQAASPETLSALGAVIDSKLAFRAVGGASSWWQLVVSGVLANWLVGMAAFFSFMGRTIIGRSVPVLLAVTAPSRPASSTAPRTWATSPSISPTGADRLADRAGLEHRARRHRQRDRSGGPRRGALLVRPPPSTYGSPPGDDRPVTSTGPWGPPTSERSTAAVSGYNYETFDGYVASGDEQREFAAWPDLLHAGDAAPEIAGMLLDGDHQIALSSVWKRRTVVVEFGSFT